MEVGLIGRNHTARYTKSITSVLSVDCPCCSSLPAPPLFPPAYIAIPHSPPLLSPRSVEYSLGVYDTSGPLSRLFYHLPSSLQLHAMDFSFDSPSNSPSLLFSEFKAKLDLPPTRRSTVDVSRFTEDGFSDFDLDLECLSRSPSPSSPVANSISSNPEDASTPSLSPPSPTPTSPNSHAVNIPSAKLSPAAAASVIRGSWPLYRYVGRGTPVDPTRRSQWGGYEAAEDGTLQSGHVRSASTDSTGRLPCRSVSPDWHHVSSDSSPSALTTQPSFLLPEESKIQFDVQPTDQSEWDSFMNTVLEPGKNATPPPPSPPRSPVPRRHSGVGVVDSPLGPVDSSSLEIDLGLDAALDLGLGLGRGMNWFELGMLPSSGFDSPSVYSSPPTTPRRSRPVSLDDSMNGIINPVTAEKRNSFTKGQSQGGVVEKGVAEAEERRAEAWWRKLLGKLRKLQSILRRKT